MMTEGVVEPSDSVVIKMEEKGQVRNEKYASDISSIREAQARIEPFIHKTLVLSSETLNSIAGRSLLFKCECFQKGGAFKFRGACNAIYSLDDDQAAKGVVTHSSGNHAAALALAARQRGIPGYIIIPKNAPKCKVENVIRYGGHVIWSEPTMQSREETATRVLQETGAVLIHPYNNGRVISGQGTIALELLEQAPQLDTIIVPISGGGLISGIALAAKSINPAIRVLAAEPKGANDAAQSKAAGYIVTLPETNTVADGLQAFLGDLTWPIVRDLVDDIIVVEDTEIIEAMKLCYEILKVAVEPSGAIGLAAVLSDNFKTNPLWKDCNNIGIILSGGNVDLGVLWNSLSIPSVIHTMVPPPPSTAKSKKKKKNTAVEDSEIWGRKLWKKTEDERLCKAWVSVYTGATVGNHKNIQGFWNRVVNEYLIDLPKGWNPSRTAQNYRQHFATVSQNANLFQNKYAEVVRLSGSGTSDEAKFKDACTLYERESPTPFNDMLAWNILKSEPKWIIYANNKYGNPNVTKKMKINDQESIASSFGTPTNNEVDDDLNTKRPLETKVAKPQINGGSSKNSIVVDLLKKIQETQLEGDGHFRKQEEEKLELARVHLAKIEKPKDHYTKMEEATLMQIQQKEEEREERYMAIDINDPSLSEVQKKFYKLKQDAIFKKCSSI